MKRLSSAQIDAMLDELYGQQDAASPVSLPPPKKGCICPNEGKPGQDGLIHHSPSCEIEGHGCRSRYIATTGMSQRDARTVGVIHSMRTS